MNITYRRRLCLSFQGRRLSFGHGIKEIPDLRVREVADAVLDELFNQRDDFRIKIAGFLVVDLVITLLVFCAGCPRRTCTAGLCFNVCGRFCHVINCKYIVSYRIAKVRKLLTRGAGIARVPRILAP